MLAVPAVYWSSRIEGERSMIEEFVDNGGKSAHERFQAWRKKHQQGLFLTLVTRARANLHGARCEHFGSGPPYYPANAGLGSLTSKLKVCGSESELRKWAGISRVMVERCQHCVQRGRLAPAGSTQYWIIKAEPDRNDLTTLALKGRTGVWYTGRPPKTWNTGDTLFIWAGSPILKLIGRGRLADPDVGFDGKVYHFRVEYLTNRIDGPTIEHLRSDGVLGTASFLKSGPSGTVFPLTREQGSRMLQLLGGITTSASDRSSKKKPTKAEEADLRRRLGSGFGSAEQNKQVELAAIKDAKKYYKSDGWNVESVEAEKIGFDLRCRKGKLERHVEVKGTAGVGAGFILTRGEYQKAESDEKYELCLVESALSNPKRRIFTGGEMFAAFEFVELAYKAAPMAGKPHEGK
jgi:Domain of unknown function (DUF3883)